MDNQFGQVRARVCFARAPCELAQSLGALRLLSPFKLMDHAALQSVARARSQSWIERPPPPGISRGGPQPPSIISCAQPALHRYICRLCLQLNSQLRFKLRDIV